MNDKSFRPWVGLGVVACIAVPCITGWLCGGVLIGAFAWMTVPVVATAFILCVCGELFLTMVQEQYRTCVRQPNWREALPTAPAIFAVAMLIGEVWAIYFAWHALHGTPRAWLLLPVYLVVLFVALLDLVLIKGLCDRAGGDL